MYQYSTVQWVLFFYMYCFFGWVFESTYVSLKSHKFVNRGFMHGPMLPIYGFGAIIVLFATLPFKGNYVMQYIMGALAATLLEYFTGIVMEAIFKVRYWDYSNQKFNLNGHICLGSSIVWGFFSILLVNVIHKPIEQMLFWLHPEVRSVLVVLITLVSGADFTQSFKEAIELREVLSQLDRARDELEELKQRLERRVDVIAAVVDDEINQNIERFRDKKDEVRNDITEYRDVYIEKMRERRKVVLENVLNRHPTLHSERFKEVIEEIKKSRHM